MEVRGARESAQRYVKKSAMAFLEGEKNPSWIIGIVRGSGLGKQEVSDLLLALRDYGDASRANELFRWLESATW